MKCECNGKHPKKNECVVCFAKKHGEICIDTKRNDYVVCDKHAALTEKGPKKKYRIFYLDQEIDTAEVRNEKAAIDMVFDRAFFHAEEIKKAKKK